MLTIVPAVWGARKRKGGTQKDRHINGDRIRASGTEPPLSLGKSQWESLRQGSKTKRPMVKMIPRGSLVFMEGEKKTEKHVKRSQSSVWVVPKVGIKFRWRDTWKPGLEE